MMLAGTLLCAAAQVLMKQGADLLPPNPSLLQTALAVLTNPTLFGGYALYGLFTVVMVVALRHGELSRLQPVIALTYVWVAILSVVIFKEAMNVYKLAGILVIMAGVAVLGRGSRS
jgi:drug/metabolite transporter (DMT)-like permease